MRVLTSFKFWAILWSMKTKKANPIERQLVKVTERILALKEENRRLREEIKFAEFEREQLKNSQVESGTETG